jgi:flagellar hook protein FlgE
MAVGSFSAALTGLNAFSSWLSVIGNNLANVNTIAYKASAVTFQDLLSQSAGGGGINPMQIGLGVTMGANSPIFSQGSIESSRDPTSCAIQGSGFFVVKGEQGTTYTRAGNFSFDQNGVLVNPEGQTVQGWTQTNPATGEIDTALTPTDITVPPGVLRAPIATSMFGSVTNLDAAADVGDSFTSPLQIYDSLGTEHVVSFNFTKTAANTWSFTLTTPGADVVGGTVGTPYVLSQGTLTFNSLGNLQTFTPAAPAAGGGTAPNITDMTLTTPAWNSGAAASALTFDLVDATGKASLSGYAAPSSTSSISQNGSASGKVEAISVNADGTILASFSGGQTVAVGIIALANFNNPKGLMKLGSNRYTMTESAGLPKIGLAGTGGRGTLIGSALEQSNVDIAQEFTAMILAQRGYQANSKTITVSDELLVETLSLKR